MNIVAKSQRQPLVSADRSRAAAIQAQISLLDELATAVRGGRRADEVFTSLLGRAAIVAAGLADRGDHGAYVTAGELARKANDDQQGSYLRASKALLAAMERPGRAYTARPEVYSLLQETKKDLTVFVKTARGREPEPLEGVHSGVVTLFREADRLGSETLAGRLIERFRAAHPQVGVTYRSTPSSASLTLDGPDAAVAAWKKDPRWARLQDALVRIYRADYLPLGGSNERTPLPKNWNAEKAVFG